MTDQLFSTFSSAETLLVVLDHRQAFAYPHGLDKTVDGTIKQLVLVWSLSVDHGAVECSMFVHNLPEREFKEVQNFNYLEPK